MNRPLSSAARPAERQRVRASAPPVARPRLAHVDEVAHAARPGFIVFSLLAVWLVSLLPWRAHPLAPDVLCLVLAYWALHEPARVGLLVAFGLGLLLDVHDAGALGANALCYTLVAYGALCLHRRLQHFGLWAQALHMLPVLLGVHLLVTLLTAWLAGQWPGWHWLGAALLSAALWVPVGAVLQLPQQSGELADAP